MECVLRSSSCVSIATTSDGTVASARMYFRSVSFAGASAHKRTGIKRQRHPVLTLNDRDRRFNGDLKQLDLTE
jgi:hypothetical protein